MHKTKTKTVSLENPLRQKKIEDLLHHGTLLKLYHLGGNNNPCAEDSRIFS